LVAIDENAAEGRNAVLNQSLQDLGNPGPERRGFSFCPADEMIERESFAAMQEFHHCARYRRSQISVLMAKV
jgi:hypothetical protein